jgi:hypothetical protein
MIALPCHSSGRNGAGGASRTVTAAVNSSDGRLGEVAVGCEHVVHAVGTPDDEAAGNGRANLMQAEREAGDDAEIAATAPNCPVQVGVLVTAGRPDLAVSGDDLDLLQVVGRPAEATREVTQPAAQRQAGDPDLRGEGAQRCRQSVGLCRPVDFLEQTPGADARELRVRVDGDLTYARHVESQAALDYRRSSHVVTPAFDAQRQAVVTRETDSRGNVDRRGRLEDKHRDFRDHAVPDEHGVVPARGARAQQRTLDSRFELVELLGREPHKTAVEAGDVDGARLHGLPSMRAGELSLVLCGHAIPLAPFGSTLRLRLGGDWRFSANSVTGPPGWPKTAGTLDDRCDDEQHRRGLRELLSAERQP